MSNEKMIRPEWIPAAYKEVDDSAGKPLQKHVADKSAALLYKTKLPQAGRLRHRGIRR